MKKKFNIKDFNDRVDFTEYEPLEPIEAIQAYCKECYCWDTKEMKQCDCVKCPFNQFLLKDFKLTKKRRTYNLSEEERQRRSERMTKFRQDRGFNYKYID